ncbi:hypothetical protein PR048_030262 [Dryococelus australis]|uniref:Uncharacterized protein n=1 Tax=Dryococelus australis TaxID=614101 RepID=A0ABQ9GBD6_9NEOP|nr:hypothetical protein PR048_030262 [Dryococelus australis]
MQLRFTIPLHWQRRKKNVIEVIKEKFDAYFSKVNLTYERYIFNKLVQVEETKFDEFLRAIINQAKKGLTYSTLSLLSTIVFLVVTTHLNGWKLDKKYGFILLGWYLLFITFASLYELNIFGNLNPLEYQSC